MPLVVIGAVLTALLAGCTTEPTPVEAGDVVPGELVQDALGSYRATTLNENAPALEADTVSVTDPEGVFSAEEALDGQLWLVRWVAEQAMDGPLLEHEEGFPEWPDFAARAIEEWLDPDYAAGLLEKVPYQDDRVGPPLLVAHDAGLPFLLRFVRDGEPRFLGGTVTLESVTAGRFQDGLGYLDIIGVAEYTGRVPEEVMLSQLAVVQGESESALLQQHPGLDDGGEERAVLTLAFGYRISMFDSGWRITRLLDNSLDYRWQG